MPMILLGIGKFIAFIAFVASGGVLCRKGFQEHRPALVVLAVLGVLSTIFLFYDIGGFVSNAKETYLGKKEYLTASEYYLRGNERMDADNVEGALSDFNSALFIAPNYAQAHYGRARILTRLGRYDEALTELDRAKTLMPSLMEADQQKIITTDAKTNAAFQPLWDDMSSRQ